MSLSAHSLMAAGVSEKHRRRGLRVSLSKVRAVRVRAEAELKPRNE